MVEKNFVVYKSSAGSGKTFTLVLQYLQLALRDKNQLHQNFKRILAITFTNKAAGEMKGRVIGAFYDLSQKKENEISKQLVIQLKISKEELFHRAQILFEEILHHYGDFAIGTIDSFTHRLVKAFAFDLKLPMNFEIETDTKSFYEKVIANLFSRVGEDAEVGKLLTEYVKDKAEEDESWDPENSLLKFADVLLKEHSEKFIETISRLSTDDLEAARNNLIVKKKIYEDFLILESQKVISIIESKKIELKDFYYGKNGAINFFYKCNELIVESETIHGKRLIDAINNNYWTKINSTIFEISSQLTAAAVTLRDYIEKNIKEYNACKVLVSQMHLLRLLKKIEEISSELKSEDGIVFISEFNNRIFKLIQNEPAPFIYERLGERYRNFLVDEFQDTSSLQWQNLLPLIDNSLASGNFNMLVGDGKQSIYRWRNANVKQFSDLPLIENPDNSVLLKEREETLVRNFKEENLDTNYRSKKNIVEFNNNFFEFLSEKHSDSMKNVFKNHIQKVSEIQYLNENLGYVSVDYLTCDSEELNDKNLTHTEKYILEAIKNGYSFGEICILCRGNKHGIEIAKYLIGKGIPVVSSESLLLMNNSAVNVLVQFLEYFKNRSNIICAAAVINYLCKDKRLIIEEQRLISSLTKGKTLFEVLSELGIEFKNLDSLNIFDLCTESINKLKLIHGNENYIRFFMDEVHEFMVQQNSGLMEFLEWWEHRKSHASLIIPEETDAVKIMTVHKSKGLEFKVVIIPYCNWKYFKAEYDWIKIKNQNLPLPVTVLEMNKSIVNAGFEEEYIISESEQILDNLNLLYVAFTRAIDRLHILSFNTKGHDRNQRVSVWLQEYFSKQVNKREGFFEIGVLDNTSQSQKKLNLSLELMDLEFNNHGLRFKSSGTIDEEAKEYGIVLHQLLSKIKSEEEIVRCVEDAVLKGLILTEDKNVWKEKIRSVVTHPQLKKYFTTSVKNKTEAEIITEAGKILRPDKVVIEGNSATILDYKTGEKSIQKHSKQLMEYENALFRMNYSEVKKIIVYTDLPEVVELN